MTFRALAAALLAASAAGLAACGGDDAGAGAAQSAGDRNRQAQVKFAQCMREHGIDFPDPGEGPVTVGGRGTTPEEMKAAEKACAKYRDAIKPPELSDAQKAEFKEAALAHARCMREHGIDFPDPTFSEDGGARVRIGAGGVEPDDDDFKAAEKACAGKLPKLEAKP
jgi:hypothetical protein